MGGQDIQPRLDHKKPLVLRATCATCLTYCEILHCFLAPKYCTSAGSLTLMGEKTVYLFVAGGPACHDG